MEGRRRDSPQPPPALITQRVASSAQQPFYLPAPTARRVRHSEQHQLTCQSRMATCPATAQRWRTFPSQTQPVCGPNGAVTFATRPKAPSDYRLASGAARSKLAHVAVAPLVRFRGMKNASTLQGVTRPVFPGAKVAVQRLEGSTWTTVVRAPVDARGRFDAQLALSPGAYRARLAPGQGFVPGISPTLRVGPA